MRHSSRDRLLQTFDNRTDANQALPTFARLVVKHRGRFRGAGVFVDKTKGNTWGVWLRRVDKGK